jgi:hypothetical protein
MKKIFMLILFSIMFIPAAVFAQEFKPVSIGINLTAGGRYDNVRMCVATGEVPGGPLADLMLNARFSPSNDFSFVLNFPILRPILFASAFSMLQFEPQLTFEFRTKISEKIYFVGGPGLGVSLNYGPDFHSSFNSRGMPFFSAGPIVSSLFGLGFYAGKNYMVTGLRIFAIPLFSDTLSGVVLGGAFDISFYF